MTHSNPTSDHNTQRLFTSRYRFIAAIFALMCLVGFTACGSNSTSTSTGDSTTTTEEQHTDEDSDEHTDEDSDEHADEDSDDHGDDEHGDEDSDDHGDDDHADEDSDDHGDDDHDDDHGDDEHGDESSSGLGAHEHGTAELTVSLIGSDVDIQLISPTQNVFGFEHEPETQDEKDIVESRTETLTKSQLITNNSDADCSAGKLASTAVAREGNHEEVTVSWKFACNEPSKITEIDAAMLFSEFSGFEDVDVQWVSDANQGAAELSPSNTVLKLDA